MPLNRNLDKSQYAMADHSDFSRPVLGILLKIGSVSAFVASNGFIKLSPAISVGEQVLIRSLVAAMVIALVMLMRGRLVHAIRMRQPWQHVWRGGLGVISIMLIFYGLIYLPLPEVTTINYATPFFVVLFGAIFLRERVGLFRWSAVLLGLSGVLVVMAPRLTVLLGGDSDLAVVNATLVTFCASLTGATAMLALRKLSRTEDSSTIVFYFFIISAVAGLLLMSFEGYVRPTRMELVWLLGAGLAGAAAQILLTLSYRYADLSTVAPFEYASIIISIVAGATVFHELPTPQMLAGGAIVMCSGLLILHHERRGRRLIGASDPEETGKRRPSVAGRS